jgi:tRNA threonylcarbamoyladenosine biosynthesis protein TsaB
MKLLVWDTSSKSGTIAAFEWDAEKVSSWNEVRLVAEFTLNVDLTHSERLLWAVHQVLQSAYWKLSDVDAIGVGIGPGSFTGLRIGLTTARTLAHTLNKPIIGISSLLALALPAALSLENQNRTTDSPTLVVAVSDACKGELFALWGDSKSILNNNFIREQAIKPTELMTHLKEWLSEAGPQASWIAVGEGRSRYKEHWLTLSEFKEIPNLFLHSDFVQGRYLGQLAWKAFNQGAIDQPLNVLPRYLRLSHAELHKLSINGNAT